VFLVAFGVSTEGCVVGSRLRQRQTVRREVVLSCSAVIFPKTHRADVVDADLIQREVVAAWALELLVIALGIRGIRSVTEVCKRWKIALNWIAHSLYPRSILVFIPDAPLPVQLEASAIQRVGFRLYQF